MCFDGPCVFTNLAAFTHDFQAARGQRPEAKPVLGVLGDVSTT